MESSPERLATVCVGYRETFWMRRNARENNFARYCLAIFPGTCCWCTDVYGCQLRSAEKCECSLLESLHHDAILEAILSSYSECIALHNECF